MSDVPALRDPAAVMRLARIGSFFPTRLSFMPTLVRRMIRENWLIDVPVDRLDPRGYGVAVYRVRTPRHTYSLVALSHELDPSLRNDRVIAEAWDATFVLFDGEPDEAALDRLAATVPLQEAARFTASELVLSRANRSVRAFEHAVDRLAAGRQPDPAVMAQTGYLMRTTAVYGNGKFGIADRDVYDDRPECAGPFQAELLTVYLIREFTLDLVEHLARARGGAAAVPLDPAARRHLGIGNSTGLGMAPFLVTHPALVSNWIAAREGALARVRAGAPDTPERRRRFDALLDRGMRYLAGWTVRDDQQMRRIARTRDDLLRLRSWLADPAAEAGRGPFWDAVVRFAEANLSTDGQEMVASLAIEPHGDVVDDLADGMSLAAEPTLDPTMSLGVLQRVLDRDYDWALDLDLEQPEQRARFWYVSEEKLEPRLGSRFEEPGAERELPFDIAVAAQRLATALRERHEADDVGTLLLERPDLIDIARRVQVGLAHPYAEVRDNLVGAECLPLHMLRCKLSFFGALRYDPLSDRWLRVTLFQGAPLRHELQGVDAEDWLFPVLGGTHS